MVRNIFFTLALLLVSLCAYATAGTVLVVGTPITNATVAYSLNIPLPNLVDSIIVEVVYGNGSPLACNFMYGTAQHAPAVAALSNASITGNGLPPKGVFRYKFMKDATAPAQIFVVLQNAIADASFIAYIYRPTGFLPQTTTVYPHHADIYWGRQAAVTRSAASPYCIGDYKAINITIPLVNKHPNRPIDIKIQTGTQLIVQRIYTPAQTGLHIAQVTLTNIMCADTQIQITISSPPPPNATLMGQGDEIITGSLVVDVQQMETQLPVTLVDFSAKVTQKTVNLQWTTSSEQNNSHFEIEKKQGEQQQIIGKLHAQGNSNTTTEYQFLDAEPTQGEAYYRLIQTDFDGKTHAYNWIKATYQRQNSKLAASIYPNPATTQNLHIAIKANPETSLTIAIYDTQGQLVHSQQLTTTQSQTPIELPNVLANGLYVAKIESTQATITQKFLVN